MRTLAFQQIARHDIAETYHWYKAVRPELAEEFFAELEKQFEQVRSRPGSFPAVHAKLRRARLDRFPYGVYFVDDGTTVIVIGVIHSSRHARAWRSRLRSLRQP